MGMLRRMRAMSDHVQPLTDALCDVVNGIIDYITLYKNQPTVDSKAITELGDSRYHKAVTNAYSQSAVQFRMACDQVIGLSCALTAEPMLTIAPWTCVRAILELTAMASWLVDLAIGAKERAGRSYALRFEGMRQQKKYADAAGSVTDVAAVVSGIDRLAADADAIGLQLFKDKGKLTGIGERFETFTKLTEIMLNEEANYRLFSAMTHGHLWAASQLGFRVNTEGESSALAVSDHLPIEWGMPARAAGHLCIVASKILITSVEYRARLFGWDGKRLKEMVSPHLIELAAGAQR